MSVDMHQQRAELARRLAGDMGEHVVDANALRQQAEMARRHARSVLDQRLAVRLREVAEEYETEAAAAERAEQPDRQE
jgi:hypothetical protein